MATLEDVAQEWYDAGAEAQNYDTSQTSRPDAYPYFDDLSGIEQEAIVADYADNFGDPGECYSCGGDTVPGYPTGLSLCCGSVIV